MVKNLGTHNPSDIPQGDYKLRAMVGNISDTNTPYKVRTTGTKSSITGIGLSDTTQMAGVAQALQVTVNRESVWIY